MSHWAQIDENNIVTDVLVGNNDEPDEGYQWFVDNLGGRWIQTSVNTHGGIHKNGKEPVRKNYAGIGYTYDEALDAFIPPKPTEFPSFIVDVETGLWTPPIPRPDGDQPWGWNESAQEWVVLDIPEVDLSQSELPPTAES
jgi:hypothetical protein